jgi:NUBPL iron-transfer P-loop NTPase
MPCGSEESIWCCRAKQQLAVCCWLQVPCIAVVENMSWFEAAGTRHFPFGQGAGERIQRDFGLPHLFKMPIVPDLSTAGDGKLQGTSGIVLKEDSTS